METDTSHTQTIVNETDKQKYGNEIIKREEVKDTPFVAVNQGQGWFAVMGDYKITEEYETKELLEKEIKRKSWKLIVVAISVIVEQMQKMNK